jgi:ZIP family zinc transporter
MVIIAPLLSTGLAPRQTLLAGLSTGLIEVFGTFLGYFVITTASTLLPFALAFAGGTMLFIICADMIPDVCCNSSARSAYAIIIGFCLMLSLSIVL